MVSPRNSSHVLTGRRSSLRDQMHGGPLLYCQLGRRDPCLEGGESLVSVSFNLDRETGIG